ncbi:MAG TPA: TlpA disulfide reductase family protein [Chryseosolibacter sp.]
MLMLVALSAFGQDAKIVKLADLQALINKKSDNIQVVNFWATWCGPCIKEMPLFEKVTAENRPGVKVTLVSMDLDLNPNPEKVYKFIERKNIKSEVLLLDEKDPDAWISKIEKEWSGSLPATIVINQKTGHRKFVGKELHEGDLERLIEEVQ